MQIPYIEKFSEKQNFENFRKNNVSKDIFSKIPILYTVDMALLRYIENINELPKVIKKIGK